MTVGFRVVKGSLPQALYVAKPYTPHGSSLGTCLWTSKPKDAFLWPTWESAHEYARRCSEDDIVPYGVEMFEGEWYGPEFATTNDPVVPADRILMETGRSKGGRRVTYRAI